jgi:hypothetical protein
LLPSLKYFPQVIIGNRKSPSLLIFKLNPVKLVQGIPEIGKIFGGIFSFGKKP